MPKPLFNAIGRLNPLARALSASVFMWREIVGIAQDFWKDGDWKKLIVHDDLDADTDKLPLKTSQFGFKTIPALSDPAVGKLWHAQPGEISERMWGAGCQEPGDAHISDTLVAPLGLTTDMSMLDLSAGLGSRLRKTADEFGIYTMGLEADPEIAMRGMNISVAARLGKRATIELYDPTSFKVSHSYDCAIWREAIYRAIDKEGFIKLIAGCCKPKSQVSFTDYIVNPEVHDQPAIVAWRAFESSANPMGLVEMAETWAKTGISLRVHEDLTDYYKKEIKLGLMRFVKFMSSGVKPDLATKKVVEKTIMIWAHRTAAMEQGLKFYRFYGLR